MPKPKTKTTDNLTRIDASEKTKQWKLSIDFQE
jgi:hypothetical protein